jgi:hypothetical protein
MTTTYTYSAIPSSQNAYPVQMAIAQLITPGREVKVQSNQQIEHWSLNGVATRVLDGFPFPANPKTSTTITSRDNPGTSMDPLTTDTNHPIAIDHSKVTNETFDVWLMFRSLQPKPGMTIDPSNPDENAISSCWVPLSHFTWTWSGEATLVNGQWTNNPSSASTPQPSPEQPTSTQPQWTNNATDLHWQ